MLTILISLFLLFILWKIMIKQLIRGADDYSLGVRSGRSIFFRSVQLTLTDSGAAGGFAAGGLALYGLDMIIRAANLAAYKNFPLLKWLTVVAGIFFLLAIVVAIFISLRSMCVIGLFLVAGIVVLEYFNILLLNFIEIASTTFNWLMIAAVLLVYFVGPFTMAIAGIVFWFIGTIGIWGPILLAVFVAIAVLIMPFFASGGSDTVVFGIGMIDWRFLAIVLVFLGISMLLEKRSASALDRS